MFRGTASSAAPKLTRIETDALLIQKAMSVRAGQINDKVSDAVLDVQLQEQEPRGILRTFVDGKLMTAEFFESTFSADQTRFLEEYLEAARGAETVSFYYSALGFPEDYVIRKVHEVESRARAMGIQGDVTFHGYLYDSDGQPREVV